MNWKWLLAGVLAILIGVGVGVVSRFRQQAREEAVQAGEPAAAPATQISLPGVLAARNTVSVPAPIEGILEVVMVTVGEEVYPNMLLASIDNTALNLELQMAEEELREAQDEVNGRESGLIAARLEASRADADLGRSRSAYEEAQRAEQRQRTLYREGATPRQVFQKAEAELAGARKDLETIQAVARQANGKVSAAEAAVETARKEAAAVEAHIEALNLDMEATQILCPVQGVITGMAARQGGEVHPDLEALFQIAVDLSEMYVVLEPNPAEMERIRPGQTAYINVAELPDQALEGTVSEMRVGEVVVAFQNPTPEVRPGLTAQVTILLQ